MLIAAIDAAATLLPPCHADDATCRCHAADCRYDAAALQQRADAAAMLFAFAQRAFDDYFFSRSPLSITLPPITPTFLAADTAATADTLRRAPAVDITPPAGAPFSMSPHTPLRYAADAIFAAAICHDELLCRDARQHVAYAALLRVRRAFIRHVDICGGASAPRHAFRHAAIRRRHTSVGLFDTLR